MGREAAGEEDEGEEGLEDEADAADAVDADGYVGVYGGWGSGLRAVLADSRESLTSAAGGGDMCWKGPDVRARWVPGS